MKAVKKKPKNNKYTPSNQVTRDDESSSGAEYSQEDRVEIEALTEHPEIVTQHTEVGKHV